MDGMSADTPAERIDALNRDGLRVIQRPDLFLFGTDSVLLADFASNAASARNAATPSGRGEKPPKTGEASKASEAGREAVLDLGTGSGVIMLLMSARMPHARFTGIDIVPEMADMARRSVALNGLEARISAACLDMRKASEALPRSFHRVVCNPPYGKAGASFPSQNRARLIARHEVSCTPDDVAAAASALLLPGGRLFMCHQPGRMLDVADAMRAHKLTPKRARLVLPAPGYPPCLLLLEAVLHGRAGLSWDAPLLLRDEQGRETDDYRKAYGIKASDSSEAMR